MVDADMTGCIVCGVANLTGARAAVPVAAELSDDLGLRLLLVHVTRPLVVTRRTLPYAGFQAVHLRDAQELLDRVVVDHELRKRAERRIEFGSPAKRLLSVAKREEAEFVVVGRGEHEGLESALLGSVSGEVARKARCPVIIVPPAMTDRANSLLEGVVSEAARKPA